MDELELRQRREKMRRESRAEAESILTLARLEWTHVWELENQYWPDAPSYDNVRRPWWLFLTQLGPVQIGWRKRVLHIDWEACAVRGIVTEDNVTKGETYVHAWNVEKAIEYLRRLREMAGAAKGGAG